MVDKKKLFVLNWILLAITVCFSGYMIYLDMQAVFNPALITNIIFILYYVFADNFWVKNIFNLKTSKVYIYSGLAFILALLGNFFIYINMLEYLILSHVLIYIIWILKEKITKDVSGKQKEWLNIKISSDKSMVFILVLILASYFIFTARRDITLGVMFIVIFAKILYISFLKKLFHRKF